MKVFIINGIPKSGKDAFVSFIKFYCHTATYNISTVDVIKEVAKTLGWDGKKIDRSRKFLSDLKDLSTEFNSFPFRYAREKALVYEAGYLLDLINGVVSQEPLIFIHSREIPEIKEFKKELNATTLLIDRPIENTSYCHADTDVSDFNYDYKINNHGTLKEFRKTAILFYEEIINDTK